MKLPAAEAADDNEAKVRVVLPVWRDGGKLLIWLWHFLTRPNPPLRLTSI